MQIPLERERTGKHPEGTLKGSITGPGLEYSDHGDFWNFQLILLVPTNPGRFRYFPVNALAIDVDKSHKY